MFVSIARKLSSSKQMILLTTLLLSLYSCAGHDIQALNTSYEKTYTQQGRNIGGFVVYNPHGLKQLTDARRNKAISRVREVCSGQTYQITGEKNQMIAERLPKHPQPDPLGGRPLRFIDFICE